MSSRTRWPTLGDRLEQARERAFVGRVAEQELWASSLAADTPGFAVLWIHGPGGVGKSALLGRFARIAREASVTPILLDARRLAASADAFPALVRDALGLDGTESLHSRLHDGTRRALLIDTAEILGPVEDWLRTQFFPSLPADCLVAVAGRFAPAASWRSDPGWSELLRVLALRNLAPPDSRALLTLRGVPSHRHDELIESTHGHPLALALVSDIVQQSGVEAALVDPLRSADVLHALLERFSHRAPDDLHRLSLCVAAHSRVTTEALLREVVDAPAAARLYDWLCSLSFAEQCPEGVFLHEVAAECIDAEHRTRDPEKYAALHVALRGAIVGPMLNSRGVPQQRAANDFVWMHRYSPLMGSLVDWSLARVTHRAPLSPGDAADIVESARRFEGDASAAAVKFWLQRQPEAFTVVRSSPDHAIGYICALRLEDIDEELAAADPRVAAGFQHARAEGPLRQGDVLSFMFWASYTTNQEPRPMLAHLTSHSMLHWIGTPRMAFSFHYVTEQPELWLPFHAYIEHHPGPTVALGGTKVMLACHDWRRMPLNAFLEVMNEREIHGGLSTPAAEQKRLVVLSQEEFADAVRRGLRDLSRPAELAANPLCRCRVVQESPGFDGSNAPALKDALERAMDLAVEGRKDEKLRSALVLTYRTPAPTQELAAERLNLPFSTYRRHLTAGVERVTAWLWQRELHGWT